GAKVVAFARNTDKLAVAKQYGADHIINIKGKSPAEIGPELSAATGQPDLDAIIDCTGAPGVLQLAFNLLSISGHYVDVGLVGDRIDVPLFPRVSREQTFHGSFWGSYTDLSEVMAFALATTFSGAARPATSFAVATATINCSAMAVAISSMATT